LRSITRPTKPHARIRIAFRSCRISPIRRSRSPRRRACGCPRARTTGTALPATPISSSCRARRRPPPISPCCVRRASTSTSPRTCAAAASSSALGGYQMLGRRINDPTGIEGPAGTAAGLACSRSRPCSPEKNGLRQRTGKPATASVLGLRDAHGRTAGTDRARPLPVSPTDRRRCSISDGE